ncbi:sulfurtransferase [Neorhizobium lilium]|nr:sulfurtransferase [Neorhizobium lilium]
MTSNPYLRRANTISAEDLSTLLGKAANLVLLDVRFTPGKPGRRESYLQDHLPEAHYIDLPTELADPVARQQGRGSNPLPAVSNLQDDLRKLGVFRDSQIVVYDDTNGAAAARAWWTLIWAGVAEVRILEGGISAWKAAGYPRASGEIGIVQPGDIELKPGKLVSLHVEQVAAFPQHGTLVDVRPAAAFSGEGTGHIPGAKSFPADRLVDPDGKFVAEEQLRQRLRDADIDIDRPLAAYCGGGIASSLFTLALAQIGKDVALYPGSWSEWTSDPNRPVEV